MLNPVCNTRPKIFQSCICWYSNSSKNRFSFTIRCAKLCKQGLNSINENFLLLHFSLLQCFSYGQVKQKSTFDFNEITFHASECNGVCPGISLQMTNDSKIEISRTIFTSKGVSDTLLSGGYIGVLDETQDSKLIALLSTIDWNTVVFSDVTSCDKPVISLLLNYNGKNKKLKSMQPAPATKELVAFLTTLGATAKLPCYDKPIDFAFILD